MGQGSINQYQAPKSPLEGIMHALQAVHSVYGINTELAQQKLLESKNIQQDQENKLGADKVENLAESKLPTSQKSQYAKANATALLTSLVDRGAIKPETASPLLSFINKPETSASDLEKFDENPQVKLAVADAAERGAKAKAEAVVTAAGLRNGPGGVGGGRADRNAMTLNKDYETSMKPYRQLQEDIARLEGGLGTKDKNGKVIITPQQLADANLASARIFSPNHMSDTTMSHTEYTSASGKLAAALQTLSNNPQDTGARSLVEHMIDQGHHILNVSNTNALAELDALDSGLQGLSPALQKSGTLKSQNLRARFSKRYDTVGDKPAVTVPENHDPEAAYQAYLNAHGEK